MLLSLKSYVYTYMQYRLHHNHQHNQQTHLEGAEEGKGPGGYN